MFNYCFNIMAFLLRLGNENGKKCFGRRFDRCFNITYLIIFRYLLFKNYIKTRI